MLKSFLVIPASRIAWCGRSVVVSSAFSTKHKLRCRVCFSPSVAGFRSDRLVVYCCSQCGDFWPINSYVVCRQNGCRAKLCRVLYVSHVCCGSSMLSGTLFMPGFIPAALSNGLFCNHLLPFHRQERTICITTTKALLSLSFASERRFCSFSFNNDACCGC